MMRARFVVLLAVLPPLTMGRLDAQGPKPPKHVDQDGMSPMGRRAARSARARAVAYMLEKGQIRWQGTMAELAGDAEVQRAYLTL